MTLWLADLVLKSGLALSAGSCLAWSLRHRSAALRHSVRASTILAVLALVPLTAVAPILEIRVPVPVAIGVTQELAPAVSETLSETYAVATATRSEPAKGLQPRGRVLDRVIPVVWLLGVVILLVRLLASHVRLAALRKRAFPIGDERILRLAAEIRRRMNFNRPVDFLMSGDVSGPAAFGVLAPAVILPAGAVSWREGRLRVVLVHELSHLRRRDPLMQIASELATALHWYNPLAWHAAARLAADREMASDDDVVRMGTRGPVYAGHLVAMAKQMARFRPEPWNSMALVARPGLKARVGALLETGLDRQSLTRAQGRFVASGAAAIVLVLATLGFAPVDRESEAIDHPRSEIVPVVNPRGSWPSEAEIQGSKEEVMIRRLLEIAARPKTWEYDLVPDRAAWALTRVKSGEIVAPLRESLEDPDWRVQAYAAWTLTVLDLPRAIPLLTRLLEDSHWRLRAQAASSLLAFGAPLPLPVIGRLSRDPAWQVRLSAVEFLKRRSDAPAREMLVQMLEDSHTGTRLSALAAVQEPGR